jgi:hypothetical protein
MRITVDPVMDIETLRWVTPPGRSYEYNGPVILFGGPSDESKANEAAQTAFFKATVEQQKETFGQQQELHDTVMKATVPILQKGPQQYGYTPEVDALLKSTIETGADQATANAVNATELSERQRSGGAQVLPSGANIQIEENARILGEQSKAKQLTAEKLSGYTAGSQLYGEALSALSGVTGRPTDYSTAASGAGSGATSAINLADSERSTLAADLLKGAVGGAATIGAAYAGNPSH